MHNLSRIVIDGFVDEASAIASIQQIRRCRVAVCQISDRLSVDLTVKLICKINIISCERRWWADTRIPQGRGFR